MSRRNVGWDHGTRSLKLATSHGPEAEIPNVVGQKPELSWAARELTPPNLIEAMEVRVDSDPRLYYVGHAALHQCTAYHKVVEEGIIVDTQRALTTGFGLAAHVLSSESSNPQGSMDVELAVVTGVPVRTSTRIIEEVEMRTRGTHYVRLRHIGTRKKIEMTLHIRNSRVLPKPYGAIFALEMDDRYSQHRDSTYSGLVIDIGEGSTDILAVELGKIIQPASTTSNIAVDTYLNELANVLSQKYDINVDPESLSEAAKRESISVFGRELDLSEFKDVLARDVAEQISSVVLRCLRALPTGSQAAKRIVLTGGGSFLFGPYLQRKLKAKGYSNIFRPPDPIMINARGFAKYATLAWPT